jgi:hypothetical protein
MSELPKAISDFMMSDAYNNPSNPNHKKTRSKVDRYFEDTYDNKSVYIWHSELSETTCEKCKAMDGRVFEDRHEAERLLPVHPNCKCWIEEMRQDKEELKTYRDVADTMYEKIINVQEDPLVLETIKQYDKNIFMFPKYMVVTNKAGSVMDFKPMLKTMTTLYRNEEGHKVYGTAIPGDSEYIYDHDIWSNVAYGYTWGRSGLMQFISRHGAQWHDLRSGVSPFGVDSNAVDLGMELREKYGDNLSKEDLEREIYLHRDKLNRWKREELELAE